MVSDSDELRDRIEGVELKTVAEWLDWRDGQATVLKRFAGEIAAQVPQSAFPRSVLASMLGHLGGVFRTAEFLVWEDPQWNEVVNAAPAFAGSRMEGLPREPQLWTWPGDRICGEEARAMYELPTNYDLGAVLLSPMPVIPPGVLEKFPEPVPGWREDMRSTDLVLAMYFTHRIDDPQEAAQVYQQAIRDGDLNRFLPRVIFAPHRRTDECRNGWEVFASGAGFLRERIFVTERLPQTRQMRRAYERRQPTHKSEVQRVILRHIEQAPGGEAAAGSREYHSRWWVGGHWRRRAEVWNRGDGPIWVKAHVRGPEEAPLVLKSQRMTSVSR